MGDSREKYRALCKTEGSIPLFSQAWWLDAVAGDHWDVVLVEKGGQVIASMPFVLKKRYGFSIVIQPAFTQSLGPWFKKNNSKYAKRLAMEKKMMLALIEQLPPYHAFSQNWDYSQTNWLPFYWQGFQQAIKYTYRIGSLVNEKNIWSGLQEDIRCEVRKAYSREGIKIRRDLDFEDFFELNRKTCKTQEQKDFYKLDVVGRLDKAAKKHDARQIFIAEDGHGRWHAGVYIAWDENSAYYLMGGRHPESQSSGAISLCLWEAIKFASTVTRSFDFSGSMIEPIGRFFRAFGALQTPYFVISRTPSRLLRLVKSLRIGS